jgi:hypothetical protein
MKKLIQIGIVGVATFAPFMALADTVNTNNGGVKNALNLIGDLISTATPIVVALALLGFFWGLAMYIFSAGDEKKRSQGRNIMIWGILALFIMLSVFGIIATLQSTLGLTQTQTIPIPTVSPDSVTGR